MFFSDKCHVVKELFYSSINTNDRQKKLAQKSLFARSFRCYQEDEYDTVDTDLHEGNGQFLADAPVYACKFGVGEKYGHFLLLAKEDGKITLCDTRLRNNLLANQGSQIHSSAVYEVCWIPGFSEFVTASGDETSIILSVREDGSLHPIQILEGHSRSVKTVHVNPYDPCVISTGSRDNSIIIWDKRCKPHHRADHIAPAHHNQTTRSSASPSIRKASQCMSVASNSVTGVLFQQQHVLLSCGASDGLIKLWDLRKTHSGGRRDPQCQNVLEHYGKSSHRGFTCMSLSPNQNVLYTSCMDNVIYAYHLANPTPKPVAEYRGHLNQNYFVKSCLSPCGTYLLSGSSDNNAYVWLTERPGQPVARLTGHFSVVTSVAWCPVDDEKLVTCADDTKLRVFRRKNVNSEDFDERMHTRGYSEPHTSDEEKKSNINEKEKCEFSRENTSMEAIPPLPATPSTSRGSVYVPSTPSSTDAKEGRNMMSPQVHPATPQLHTPRQKKRGKGRITPCTPKTGERNTLLQWLASSKTPGPKESPTTRPLSFSETKKANLKRKLTELLCEDQENAQKEKNEMPSKSPPKQILGSSSAINTSDPPVISGVAKMLKYEEASDINAKIISHEDNVAKFEYLQHVDLDKVNLDVEFRKPVTNICTESPEDDVCNTKRVGIRSESSEKENKNNIPKSFRFGQWSSPTANLPNYVLDGASPHNRPEIKKEKRKNIDWLTNFSHQRKIKFSRKHSKAVTVRSGYVVPKRTEKKILHIKGKS
ncbi:hypothetical protein SK128_020087 [Halocaridina rubra]|uniref:Denticleless protein homolog n=1 Tax=Halocaridina rubra TaxID=373956 RepID=A0AAN9AG72_HALRR